jgi:hypothetical protein
MEELMDFQMQLDFQWEIESGLLLGLKWDFQWEIESGLLLGLPWDF